MQMIFGGFQKLTLLDFPGKVSCTLFTKGCNFLCPFCHNAPLVNRLSEASDFSEEEILSFLKKRQGILEGVAITGGEPLLHTELVPFIKKVRELGFAVKLDTNGTFPKRLKALVENRLVDYVAMDIKNSREKYAATAGCDRLDMDAIEESIDFLLSGPVEYEFRTTVTKELHTTDDIRLIAQRIKGAEKYFIQNFSDSGNTVTEGHSPVDAETVNKMCQIGGEYTKCCKNR